MSLDLHHLGRLLYILLPAQLWLVHLPDFAVQLESQPNLIRGSCLTRPFSSEGFTSTFEEKHEPVSRIQNSNSSELFLSIPSQPFQSIVARYLVAGMGILGNLQGWEGIWRRTRPSARLQDALLVGTWYSII